MAVGKVWLVGAGPGDEGLLTVKGQNVLEKAEAVVYDALVGMGVLARIPAGAECIYVGKRSGRHAMPQEEINRCLVSLSNEGKRVVRLKGGDPFLFGRGGEEAEVLAAHHIPFEVVPGVSSALAVPAYCGIPVTHREHSSSVHIITGHKKGDGTISLDFDALCRLDGTLIFLMGAAALPYICRGLLRAGMDETTPAAFLSQGTTAHQRSLVATVKTLPEKVEQQGVAPPAVLVVGQVCSLSEVMEWHGKLPLSGTNVLVTRPGERSGKLAEPLRVLGAQVWEIPSIEIVPIKENRRLEQALEDIGQYHWLVFTSPSGVDVFFGQCCQMGMDIRRLAGLRVAVIGAGTRDRLQRHGIFEDVMPEVYSARQLGRCLAAQLEEGQRILIPRAREGSRDLIRELENKPGVHIADVPVYDTRPAGLGRPWLKRGLLEGEEFVAVFTSASTVRYFMEGIGRELQGSDKARRLKAACIGKQTGQEAGKWGLEVSVAREATVDGLVELILEMES